MKTAQRRREYDADRRETHAYRRWYKLAIWRRIRDRELHLHPTCGRCAARGLVVVATVVNHTEPHRGDWERFVSGPFETMCAQCHDSDVQSEEAHGYSRAIGADGLPSDPRHPFNIGGGVGENLCRAIVADRIARQN